jgi:molybdate transport system ATP-binding protein
MSLDSHLVVRQGEFTLDIELTAQPGEVVALGIELAGPIAVAADVTPAAAVQLDLAPGREIWASLKASEVTAYPA